MNDENLKMILTKFESYYIPTQKNHDGSGLAV